MKKILVLLTVLSLACASASAQSFLERLGQRAKNAAEQNIGNKVEKGVNDVLDGKVLQGNKEANQEANKESTNKKATVEADEHEHQHAAVNGWTCPECGHQGNTGKFCEECGAKQPGGAAATWDCPECGHKGNTGKFCEECGAKKPGEGAAAAPAKKQAQTGYAKTDFVPGDEIFFDDPVEGEKVGEFPSHWDFLQGEECEIMTLDGVQVIKLSGWCSEISPLMKEADYLPEEFTIEFDVWSNLDWGSSNNDHLDFILLSDEHDPCVRVCFNPAGLGPEEEGIEGHVDLIYDFVSPSGERREGSTPGNTVEKYFEPGTWTKVQASFNKRAFKYYINGNRVVNLPNVVRPTRFKLSSVSNCDEKDRFYIKNIRMAKGAVPLYDRLASEGKIVTYAITFETGKADIKPESMVEINRIAELMKSNPGLEFEVQGHCDATGSDKVNDPLSQKRAEAIVAALVEQGIAQSRLSAVGKGSHVPIASNSTDEGRAKNRRVEFVKK